MPDYKINGFSGFSGKGFYMFQSCWLPKNQLQEDSAMLLQTLQFQKEICSASFIIATSVQENCENILKDTLALTPLVPEQGKDLCLYYSEQYWLSLERMKKTSLASLDLFAKLTSPPAASPEKRTTRRKKAVAAAPPKTTPRKKTVARNSGAATKQVKAAHANASAAKAKQTPKNTAEPAAPKKSPATTGSNKKLASNNTTSAEKS